VADVSAAEVVLRVCLTAVPAAAIGLERESTSQPAGLRTHMLLGLGACLFTLAGLQTAGADPTRVAAQVASGVGFLGAGAVLQSRLHVSGLTTAASLWVTAAIGVAAGLGAYVAVVATTLLAIVVLAVLHSFERHVPIRKGARIDVLLIEDQLIDDAVREIREVLPRYRLRSVHAPEGGAGHRLVGDTYSSRSEDISAVATRLQSLSGVLGVELREP
jgi:putative Mg2+ transporter-C (MgtC) family protein